MQPLAERFREPTAFGGLSSLSRTQKLLIVLGLSAAGYAFLNRKTLFSTISTAASSAASDVASKVYKIGSTVFDFTKAAAFKSALLAATPSGRAAKYSDVVLKVAEEQQISPFLIVAVMERESHSGLALTPPNASGTGDGGHGRGLMQIDDRTHGGTYHGAILADGRWTDPYWNMTAAVVDHLKPDQKYFTGKGLTGDALLRATLAAYNAGAGAVWTRIQAGQDPDDATAGGDYGADVISRLATISQAFQQRA